MVYVQSKLINLTDSKSLLLQCPYDGVVSLVYGWPKPYIHTYIRCIYGTFGRELTIHTVIYGVHIRFWPTLVLYAQHSVLYAQNDVLYVQKDVLYVQNDVLYVHNSVETIVVACSVNSHILMTRRVEAETSRDVQISFCWNFGRHFRF